jgi:flagellar hook-associated protein 2
MAGALSTLGLGSQGVLTNDLLDQLKEADKTATITPIENKQKSLKLQQAGLTGLKDAISDLSDLATSLSDLSLYQSKSSNVTGDSVTIEASASAKTQEFDLNVLSLATRDIQQSTGFASKTDTLSAGSMHLEIDGSSYDVTIEDTDTLESLAEKISDATEGKISASILNVGGDTPYTMVLKSTETGASNNITTSGDISFTRIGSGAQDASLEIDGIAVTSATNEISNLVDATTITLTKTGESHISITQDSEKIVEKMQEFVTKYNELIDSVKTMTNYDPDTKVAGVFSGSSEIRGMMAPLNDIFFTAINDSGKMIEDFGLSADRSGKLTLDKDKFTKSLEDDSQSVQNFFVGEGTDEGIFRQMNGELFEIGTSSDGILKTLKANYDEKSKSLIESLEKAQERLDNKYEIMQKKFASYDAVIGRLSNESATLTSLIDSQNTKN